MTRKRECLHEKSGENDKRMGESRVNGLQPACATEYHVIAIGEIPPSNPERALLAGFGSRWGCRAS
ncbi:hypothetical protein KCP70_05230 [Salmonella enterica subsp. enterica]|nr:hypothetical protein KCP70_05230 [Salmonella enterica subsp. enterica]